MSKVPTKPNSNPILSGFINMFFDLIKHFMKDFENMRKVKKIDNMGDKFANLEHMLVRLENILQENRRQIEELKNRLLWGNIIIIILVGFAIYEVIK